jgi:hypothetical protein
LYYPPNSQKNSDALREVNSTNIHFPLLLKFSLRTGNIRPYAGGVSATLNLSSNSKLIDDNLEQRFRVKSSTNYELGLELIFSLNISYFHHQSEVFFMNDELLGTKTQIVLGPAI